MYVCTEIEPLGTVPGLASFPIQARQPQLCTHNGLGAASLQYEKA